MIFEDVDYDDAMCIGHGKTELIRTKQKRKMKNKKCELIEMFGNGYTQEIYIQILILLL